MAQTYCLLLAADPVMLRFLVAPNRNKGATHSLDTPACACLGQVLFQPVWTGERLHRQLTGDSWTACCSHTTRQGHCPDAAEANKLTPWQGVPSGSWQCSALSLAEHHVPGITLPKLAAHPACSALPLCSRRCSEDATPVSASKMAIQRFHAVRIADLYKRLVLVRWAS